MITCDHPFKYLDYSGRLYPVDIQQWFERLNMRHTKPESTLVTKTKIEFLNPSNQKMFIFYRKICKKIIFQTALLS